ncbi:MAG: CPBP family intramembrane glutamic endopeptidase [Dysgonamonadaceae bacterium]
MKQFLSDKGNGMKIFYLLLFSFLGLLVAISFLAMFGSIFGLTSVTDVWYIRISSILQEVFVFLLPAYIVAVLSDKKPLKLMELHGGDKLASGIILGIILFCLAYPFISYVTQWNTQIEFPDALKNVETWMRNMEDAAKQTTDQLLAGNNIGNLVLNILLVAGLAALSEEIFFRGALQTLLNKAFKNGHAAVWVSAIIFSSIHFQFYGFFARLLMGAILGYLFLYSKNLWVPIIVHFFNNAMVIITNQFWGESEWTTEVDSKLATIPLAVSSLIITILAFIYFRKQQDSTIKKL